MNARYIPMSFLKEWNFCHCVAKYWGREIPRNQDKDEKNLSKMYELDAPIVTDELSIIHNNFEQKTTLFVDNGLLLMGSIDFIIFNKVKKKSYIFKIKDVKKIPSKAYSSDKNLAIAYNIILFRFLHREPKNYQVKFGFEFLESYKSILEDLPKFKIGNPAIGYTTNKSEFIEDLILEPEDFFEKHDDTIFFVKFSLKNIIKSLDQLIEMIDECREPYYIERNHDNKNKCKNCYYNKHFSCEDELK